MKLVTIHITLGLCYLLLVARSASSSELPLSRASILDAARAEVRRHGEARTGVVDVARSLGVSHAALYRHFSSKAALMDALAEEVMTDEEALARAHVEGDGPAALRLEALVLDLHHRKRERLQGDREIHDLHRRIVAERPEIVAAYAERMTGLVERLLRQGVERGEFAIQDPAEAAGVVRDAVTAFVHPALVERDPGPPDKARARLKAVIRSLTRSFEGKPNP